MVKIESKIINISNLFEHIYRLTLDNKMEIDVYEKKSPKVGNLFSCLINENISENFIITEMNGYVYKILNNFMYISFGGLLCKIPKVLINGLNDGVKLFTLYYHITPL